MSRKCHNHTPLTNPRNHETEAATWHHEDNKSKAISSLFPSEMIAKLERIQSTEQHNKDQTKSPQTMGATNNNSTTALEWAAVETNGGRPYFDLCLLKHLTRYLQSY